MNNRGSIANLLSSAKPSYFLYYMLPEFTDPEYNLEEEAPLNIHDRDRNLNDAGLVYILKAKSYIGRRLSELRDAFFREGDKSKLVTDLAGDIHKFLDQAESLETQLKRKNLHIIAGVLENELTMTGIDKILKAGHSLTDIAEKCALDVLYYVGEFDPRKTASDYYAFLRDKLNSPLKSLIRSFYASKSYICWKEFKKALDSGFLVLENNFVYEAVKKIPRRAQRYVIIGLYGLDGNRKTKEELARSMNKSQEEIERLEKQALTHLGIKIDPIGFLDSFHGRDSRKKLERKNRKLWNYLKRGGILKPSLRRDYGENPIEIYRERYPGVSRGKLPYIDSPLYLALKYHGQLHLVPTIKAL